ncbi:MAG: cation transporter [Gemmatimonadaceae bacterium]
MATASADARHNLVRRGLYLNYLTIAYNTLEAVASVIVGIIAGSIALVSFGFDSVIELSAGVAAQWRLRAEVDATRREDAERWTRRIVGWSFIALGAYITYESCRSLWYEDRPEGSLVGVLILAASIVVMPLLARAKRRVARGLASHALASEATQTALCAYLSAIALAGIGLNTLFGWWWADPAAALLMVPIVVHEGVEGLRQVCSDDCC